MQGIKGQFSRVLIKLRLASAAGVLVFGGLGVLVAAPVSAAGGVLYVSQANGVDNGTCGSVVHPCKTIGKAVTNANAGSTIIVRAGTYHEQVNVAKTLRLTGQAATVDATGLINGILIGLMQPGTQAAAGSSVTGFTVKNATGEGILAVNTNRVSISNNTVTHNDLGEDTTVTQECTPIGDVPGDCGEGLHLMSVANSMVMGNDVNHNTGGILVTDEFGPNHDNLIENNSVTDNADDCGITVPSHNTSALSATGVRQPSLGGVYHNRIIDNFVSHNGASGEGAAVLFAAAAPGAASYENTVIGNTMTNNGLSGVTIHSHAPNQDLNGNRIIGNTIGKNNLNGDADAPDMSTTGVLIFSAVVPVTGTQVIGNKISDDVIGIWLSHNASTTKTTGNTFNNVTTPVFVAP